MSKTNNCGHSGTDSERSCMPDSDRNLYTGLSPLPNNTVNAMAYIPFQTDRNVYDANTALCNGTLFPVLNKPFLGACRR